MACISKLANSINYDCDSGTTGIISAMIINKADISSFVVSSSTYVTNITLNPGATPYVIDTVKRSCTISSSLKVNDGAPNAQTHTVTLTIMAPVASAEAINTINALSNGSFVVLALHAPGTDSRRAVYGLYYGLSATAIDRHSHDNGAWFSVTLSTPENVIGEDPLGTTTAEYNRLYAAAVSKS